MSLDVDRAHLIHPLHHPSAYAGTRIWVSGSGAVITDSTGRDRDILQDSTLLLESARQARKDQSHLTPSGVPRADAGGDERDRPAGVLADVRAAYTRLPAHRRAGSVPFHQQDAHSGHPTCCAVALSNLDIIERERLVERSAADGARLLDKLRTLAALKSVGHVRGQGLIAAVEVVADKTSKSLFPAAKKREAHEDHEEHYLVQVFASIVSFVLFVMNVTTSGIAQDGARTTSSAAPFEDAVTGDPRVGSLRAHLCVFHTTLPPIFTMHLLSIRSSQISLRD